MIQINTSPSKSLTWKWLREMFIKIYSLLKSMCLNVSKMNLTSYSSLIFIRQKITPTSLLSYATKETSPNTLPTENPFLKSRLLIWWVRSSMATTIYLKMESFIEISNLPIFSLETNKLKSLTLVSPWKTQTPKNTPHIMLEALFTCLLRL